MTPSTSSDRLRVFTQAQLMAQVRRGQVLCDRGGWWWGEQGETYGPWRGKLLVARGWAKLGQRDAKGDSPVMLTSAGLRALADWEAKHDGA